MLEQRVSDSQTADSCAIASELQLCVSKLQPIVDICCAVLLKSDTPPDLTSLLDSSGLYNLMLFHKSVCFLQLTEFCSYFTIFLCSHLQYASVCLAGAPKFKKNGTKFV